MNISFGKYKGYKISNSKNKNMRPTTSIAKKVIFSWLKISENDVVLDLFSGTGSLGFESLSLGAKKVIMVDRNYESILSISKTANILNLSKSEIFIHRSDFRGFLKSTKEKYDKIFIDPPFIENNYWDESLDLISKKELLNQNGVIVIEIPIKYNLDIPLEYSVSKTKLLGDKKIILLNLD